MKKFIFILLLICIVSCQPSTWMEIGKKTQSIELVLNLELFDSIIIADSINLDGCITVPLKDYETKLIINKSMYIRDSIIYTILKTDSCYYFEKRTNK